MNKINFKQYDLSLAVAVLFLVIIGSIMVFSAGLATVDAPYSFFFKQLIFAALGLIAMFFTSFHFNYKNYQIHAGKIFVITSIILILVLIFGVSRNGATRWFVFGGQPSEFAKITAIICIANFISVFRDKSGNLRQDNKTLFLNAGLPVFIIGALIFLEKDLGTPVLICFVCVSMLFCAGLSMKKLGALISTIFLLVACAVIKEPYRLQRIKAYFAPLMDIYASSGQLQQSIYALGSGGFWGKWLTQSDLKYFYLQEPHTDFIFPIIGEELGFLGILSIMIIFIFFVFRKGFIISQKAREARNTFGQYLALGITLLFVFQVIINLAGATGLLPIKGLVLPFISYGNTAMVMNLAAAGILINISKKGR